MTRSRHENPRAIAEMSPSAIVPAAIDRWRRIVRRSLLILAPIAATVPVLLGALPACAHAILLASTPAGGATVPAGAMGFSLRFNSRIDRERSVVRLVGADRRESVLSVLAGDGPDILQGKLDLSPGRYILRWQVLAVDGHITRGDVPFAVAP